MNWILFFYYLGHLLTRLLLILTVVNLLVCGNILLLKLTFWLLQKTTKPKRIDFPSPLQIGRGERPTTAKPVYDNFPSLEKTEFVDAKTGEKEGWEKKTIWIRKD